MTLRLNALIACVAMMPIGFAVAQTTPPQDETAPSAASSPHQRNTTKSDTQEAPATSGTEPTSASTPHQKQATADAKGDHMQMMKDCVAKEQAKDSSKSKDDVKKACKDQMKQHSDSMSKQ